MKTIILALLLVVAASAGPVSHFGALKVCGKNICGEKTGTSTSVFFKGPSLYWSVGQGAAFYSPDVVDWFVDNMQIGIIRAAMGIRYYKENSEPINVNSTNPVGYYDDPARQKNIMKAVIEAAIVNDIYVIVDWHSHNAENETSIATTFFRELATEYKDVPNIIWEVYNEPVGASASTITSYSKTIRSAIRGAGNNNLVLIGSNFYSQNPSQQASNYGIASLAQTDNVAFTFHFYAGTHPQSGGIGSSATTAMNNGYAVFGTEWGTTNADGSGTVQTSASDTWTNWMDNNKISNCMWSASAIDETSAIFTSGTSPTALAINRLTTNGRYFETYMGKNKWTAQIPSTHPKGNDVNATVVDGSSVTISSSALGLTGNITGIAVPPTFGTATFTSNSVTYTTAASGSPNEKVRFAYEITQNNVKVQRRVTVTITNRRPILPERPPVAVSRKTPTKFQLNSAFTPTDPSGLALSFRSVSNPLNPSHVGTISIKTATTTSGDTLIFTPSAAMSNAPQTDAELTYSIQNTAGQYSTATRTLQIQNIAPRINESLAYNCCGGENPNTAPVRIGMSQVGARDTDEDPLTFDKFYLHPQYPGTLTQIKPDTLLYTPEANKTGRVVIFTIVSDGDKTSVIGSSAIRLTGSGTAIGDLPVPPAEIPGVVNINFANPGSVFGLKPVGFGRVAVDFAQDGHAKLDVYSLSGKLVGTLLNGWQNAGSSEVSLKNLNLQRGIYILRLRQGSQVKTLRIVN